MTRLGDTIYRLMLLAFPTAFRRRHGHDMRVQFQRQCERIGVRPVALSLFVARSAVDALSSGLAARRDARPSRARHAATRSSRGDWFLPGFGQDVRHAVRGLLRDRGVTAVVVVTLTLGISANAIMFGVVDQLLLSPPAGVGRADGLRRIYFGSESPNRRDRATTSNAYPQVAAVRDGVPSFTMASVLYQAEVSIGAGADARGGRLELVNASYFPMLELRPFTGRFFTADEDTVPHGAPVVVLSHEFWQREFGADASVVGSTIRIEDKPFTVVGIGPERFAGTNSSPVDLWTPPGALAPVLVGQEWHTKVSRFGYSLVARLAPGAADAVANAEATAAARYAAPTDLPPVMVDTLVTAFGVRLAGVHDPYDPSGTIDAARVGLWLLGVSAVVLMIAMANVAYVLLASALARRREIGVRLALGISRGRLVRLLLAESSVLTGLAASVALAVAWTGGAVVQRVVLPDFAWDRIVDGRVLAVTLGLTGLTALGAGLGPALYALAADVNAAIRPSQRVATGHAGVARTALMVTQITLSVVLLVGAGLFVRSFQTVSTQDAGIDLDQVILARLPDRPDTSLDEANALHGLALERLVEIDGVERVALTRLSGPMSGGTAISARTAHETLSDLNGRAMPGFVVVTAGYFATIGATIERGRGFTEDDEREGPDLVVVTSAMASDRWPDGEAVGECLFFPPRTSCNRVIGVVENTLNWDRVGNNEQQLFLLATHSKAAGAMPRSILVRTSRQAGPEVRAIRAALQALSADMPFVPVDTMESLTASQLQPWRLGATMFLIFGGVALLIAAVGLYSAMTHLVAQRTHEIGVRLALGASRRHVISRIGRQGAAAVAGGIAIGLLAAAAASHWLADLLYQTSPRDPWVFATVAVVLATSGLAAALVPLRRSTAVDPLIVLKADN